MSFLATFSTNFLDLFISPLYYCPNVSSFLCHISPLMHVLPTSSPGVNHCPPGHHRTRPFRHPPLLISAPPSACLRLPPCPACEPPPPLTPSACSQVPVSPWWGGGGWPFAGPSASMCPCLILLVSPSYPGIFWVFSFRVDFAQGQEAGAPQLPGSFLPWSSLPRYLSMLEPFYGNMKVIIVNIF